MTDSEVPSLEKLSGDSTQWGISSDDAKEIIMSCLLNKQVDVQGGTKGSDLEFQREGEELTNVQGICKSSEAAHREFFDGSHRNSCMKPNRTDTFFCDDILDDITAVIATDKGPMGAEFDQDPDPSNLDINDFKSFAEPPGTNADSNASMLQPGVESFQSDVRMSNHSNISLDNGADIVGPSFLEAVGSMSLEDQISGHCSKEETDVGASKVTSTIPDKLDVETDGPYEFCKPQSKRQSQPSLSARQREDYSTYKEIQGTYERQSISQASQICILHASEDGTRHVGQEQLSTQNEKQQNKITARSPHFVKRPKAKHGERALNKVLSRSVPPNSIGTQHILSTVQAINDSSPSSEQALPFSVHVNAPQLRTIFRREGNQYTQVLPPNANTNLYETNNLAPLHQVDNTVAHATKSENYAPTAISQAMQSSSNTMLIYQDVSVCQAHVQNQIGGQCYSSSPKGSSNTSIIDSHTHGIPQQSPTVPSRKGGNSSCMPSRLRENQQQGSTSSNVQGQSTSSETSCPPQMRGRRLQYLMDLVNQAQSASSGHLQNGAFNLQQKNQLCPEGGNTQHKTATQIDRNNSELNEFSPQTFMNIANGDDGQGMKTASSSSGRNKAFMNIHLPSEKRHDRVKAWVNETTYFKQDLDSGIWDPNDCSLRQELPVLEGSKNMESPNSLKKQEDARRPSNSKGKTPFQLKGSGETREGTCISNSECARKPKPNVHSESKGQKPEGRQNGAGANIKDKTVSDARPWKQNSVPDEEINAHDKVQQFLQSNHQYQDNGMRALSSFQDADKEIEELLERQRMRSLENKQRCLPEDCKSENATSSLEQLLVANGLLPAQVVVPREIVSSNVVMNSTQNNLMSPHDIHKLTTVLNSKQQMCVTKGDGSFVNIQADKQVYDPVRLEPKENYTVIPKSTANIDKIDCAMTDPSHTSFVNNFDTVPRLTRESSDLFQYDTCPNSTASIFKKPPNMINHLTTVTHQPGLSASDNSTHLSVQSMLTQGEDSDVSMRSGDPSMSMDSWPQKQNTTDFPPNFLSTNPSHLDAVANSSSVLNETELPNSTYPNFEKDIDYNTHLLNATFHRPEQSNTINIERTLSFANSVSANAYQHFPASTISPCSLSTANPSVLNITQSIMTNQSKAMPISSVTRNQTTVLASSACLNQANSHSISSSHAKPHSTEKMSNYTNMPCIPRSQNVPLLSAVVSSGSANNDFQNFFPSGKLSRLSVSQPTVVSHPSSEAQPVEKASSKISGFDPSYDCGPNKITFALQGEIDDLEEIIDDDDAEIDDPSSINKMFIPDEEDGETCLHLLCEMEKDRFEWLASQTGFAEALNLKSKSQETALFVAVKEKRLDAVQFLISHGADVNICCLSRAKCFRSERVLQTALHEAIEIGNKSIVKALVESPNVDVNLPRPNCGQTPLMLALQMHGVERCNNREQNVSLILDLAPCLEGQDNIQGKTALMYAIQTCDVTVVLKLLDNAGPLLARKLVSAKAKKDLTCLHFAAQLQRITKDNKKELLKRLIMAGGDASARNTEKETPRDWAKDEITQVLMDLK